MHHTDNTRRSTRRSYAEILATVKAQRLRGDSTPAAKLPRRPPADVLRKGSTDDLAGFAPAAVAAARALIAKVGYSGAVAQVQTLRQHAQVGLFAPMFHATQMRPVAKADLPTPPKKPPQTAIQPVAVAGARIAERQNRYVDPDDTQAIHNEMLRETAAAAARLHASMRQALSPQPRASTGPDAAPGAQA